MFCARTVAGAKLTLPPPPSDARTRPVGETAREGPELGESWHPVVNVRGWPGQACPPPALAPPSCSLSTGAVAGGGSQHRAGPRCSPGFGLCIGGGWAAGSATFMGWRHQGTWARCRWARAMAPFAAGPWWQTRPTALWSWCSNLPSAEPGDPLSDTCLQMHKRNHIRTITMTGQLCVSRAAALLEAAQVTVPHAGRAGTLPRSTVNGALRGPKTE